MTRPVSAWIVRAFWLLLAFVLVTGYIRANVRIDRVDARETKNRTMGAPSDTLTQAQEAVSVWAHQPAVVVDVVRDHDHWVATAMTAEGCYQLKVYKDKVSPNPGHSACPTVEAAVVNDHPIDTQDERRPIVASFLGAWLTGDITADRYLADNVPGYPMPPVLATKVVLGMLHGKDAASTPGTRSTLTADADVSYAATSSRPARVERQSWTVEMVHGDTRWSILNLTGGAIPSGDKTELKQGWTPDTTLPTTTTTSSTSTSTTIMQGE